MEATLAPLLEEIQRHSEYSGNTHQFLIQYSLQPIANLGSTKRTETDFGQSNPTKQSLLCLPLCWLHRMSIDSFCEQPSKDNKAVTILITGIFLAS